MNEPLALRIGTSLEVAFALANHSPTHTMRVAVHC